jgi:transposase InsO family protein
VEDWPWTVDWCSGAAPSHTVIDDHSRVAYAEIHDDETATTATGVLHRAVGWFADRGVTVERVLSDNGSAYRSHLCETPAKNLPSSRSGLARTARKPTARSSAATALWPTGGHKYARCYRSELERRKGLEAWLHHYNHHRPTLPAPVSRPSRD